MNSTSATNKKSVFELKGSVMTILVLHIKNTDADYLYAQLIKKMSGGRSFFNNAPVLIDVSAVEEEGQAALDFPLLTQTLRRLGVVPVGIRGIAACLQERVLQAGLGLLPNIKAEKRVEMPAEPQSVEKVVQEVEKKPEQVDDKPGMEHKIAPAKVITAPIRSGQQVFAPEGDLIILSSVNAGSEVLAAGNIHVYGALRGRAMAGIHGNTKASIFSLQCNPELVAVAGEYIVNELLDEKLLNRSVLISLADGCLQFDLVGSFTPAP